jgi:7-cyano-7-deazaguanine synthase
MAKKAVVLLSGGLDSATCLAVAKSQGFECYTLSFDYGQRNRADLLASQSISKFCGAIEHKIFDLNLRQWGGSALTDDSFDVPKESAHENDIPITYVPARNLVFLSLATAWGEVVGAKDIFIGVNSVDYSNYPDCRDSFIKSFSQTARLGTKACDENWQWKINTPLQNLSKAEIIKLGTSLGLDYSVTLSCYDPTIDGLACGECASCRLRKAGFADAGVPDPTRYK